MLEKQWQKITIDSGAAMLGSISDFLVDSVGAGVEMAPPEEPGRGKIVAFLERSNPSLQKDDALSAQVSTYLSQVASTFSLPVPTYIIEQIEEEGWIKRWKSQYRHFAIVPGLVIVPSWEEYTLQPGEQALFMDPGMAFGTGLHASTSFCLQLFLEQLKKMPGATVLDVGTGTGILAMIGLVFGAGSVLGIDNSEVAVAVTKKNAERNGFSEKLVASTTPVAQIHGTFEIVVANLINNVILEVADDLARLTAKGGYLVLSGLIVGDQLDSMEENFVQRGFTLEKERKGGEYAAFLLKKM